MKPFLFPKILLPLFLASLGAVVTSARAQSLNLTSPTNKEPEKMTIRVVSTNLTPNFQAPKWAMVGLDGTAQPLVLIPWNISSPVVVPLGGRILIYDQEALEKSLQTKEKHLPTPVLDLAAPANSKSSLIVAKPTDSKNWNCQVYDESTGQYAAGSRLFLNLSRYPVSGVCGKAAFEIPPQGASLVQPGVEGRAIVQVYATLPTRKATVLDEQWAFPKQSRGVCLIFDAEGGAIRMVGIPDEAPPEPKPDGKKG